MQMIDSSPPVDRTDHAHLLRALSAMLAQIDMLQNIARGKSVEGNAQVMQQSAETGDLAAMRNGLAALEQMVREMLYDVRSVSDDLPLDGLPGMPLSEALSLLVDDAAETMQLSSRVIFSGEERPLTSEIERLLYRIARDSLAQVQQHSDARKLRFVLHYGRDEAQMSIEDDGVPSEPSIMSIFVGESTGSLAPPFASLESSEGSNFAMSALLSLRNRVEHLGGTFEVNSGLEQGTQVHVSIPYAHHIHDTADSQALPAQSLPSTVPLPAADINQLRLLIVDNQAVTRAGLRRLLESYADLRVVGEAVDGVQAVSETAELGPQVVILDAQLPQGQSLEALRQIKQLNPDTHVLLLSTLDREEYLYETLRAGAEGYVLKDIAPDELAQAVRTVARGEVLVQPQIAGRLISRFGKQGRAGSALDALTARELEVLRLLARGLRNKEIAARLFVSERTVNFHLANIYQKLNVSGRTEALSKAHEQGLITV
jgi:DNA-binding NarL/FixJ family response regulator